MAIKKVKLNYISAVSKKQPVEKIVVPSNQLETLRRSIRQKTMRNATERYEARQ